MLNPNFAKNRIIVLALAIMVTACLPSGAYAVSKSEIDAVRQEREAVTEQKKAQQIILDELSKSRDDVIGEKLALEEHIALTREQISLNEKQIDVYASMIAEKSAEVDEAKALEEHQLEMYRARVRAMEENGELNLMVMLSQTNTLADLLTAIDDAGEIMERDRELEDQYISARENHEAVRAEYEEYKASLESIEEVLEAERDQLEIEISTAQGHLDELNNQISENADLLEEIERRWAELDSKVSEMQDEYDRERAYSAVTAVAPGSLSGAGFIWPCGSNYITSRAGSRVHPITGAVRNHSGMDIGLGEGQPVWAAASGTVSLAGWNGDYGNCVMIEHGNGYTTLYAHMSSVAVSEGQGVGAGDVVGYCGSTGLATGPHLHFEVRSGGAIDPESFFPAGSFTFAPDCGN